MSYEKEYCEAKGLLNSILANMKKYGDLSGRSKEDIIGDMIKAINAIMEVAIDTPIMKPEE